MADSSPAAIPPTAAARFAEDYALVVGIDTYPRLAAPLRGALNDAEAFYSWLIDANGGGLDANNIFKLCSPAPQPNPPVPGNDLIDNAFENLMVGADDRGGRIGRRLYIYLAGHGFAVDVVNDARLLVATGGPGATGNHVIGPRYAEWFIKSKFFDEVVLIMDCCRANFQAASARIPPWDPVVGTRKQEIRYTFLFGTKAFASARELEIADNGRTAHRGVFTHALLSVLRTTRRTLTGSELRDQVNNRMIELYQQHAPQDSAFRQLAEALSSTQEPLLGSDAGGVKVTFAARTERFGQSLTLRDGGPGRRVIHQIPWAGTTDLLLDPGLYSIEGPNFKQLFEVLATEDQRVDF